MLGENNKNLGKIVAVLAKCLGKGSGGKDSLVDADTWQKIVTLLQQMNSSLPPTVSCSLFLMVACLDAHVVSYDALMMWCQDVTISVGQYCLVCRSCKSSTASSNPRRGRD